MNDEKPRKPLFGARGPLPGGAGRYSLSSRPPKPETDSDGLAEEPKITIPGPSRIPKEILDTSAPASPDNSSLRPAAADAWKGSTVGGIGVQVPSAVPPKAHDFKTTLALGSAPLRDFLDQRDEFSPGTIRGTPPPARPETSNRPPAFSVSSIPPKEGQRPTTGARESASVAPQTPKTERATVPPRPEGRSRGAASARPFEVESARPSQSVNTALHPDLLPVCDDIGQSCATEPEVALLASPRDSRDSLYASAVAIARRLSQALPGEVVLVETDFESPGLAQTLGVTLPKGRGFSEQLHARAWSASASNLVLTNAGLGFDALFEGRLRTPGLLWSDQFASVIATLRGSYSVILLVAPNRLTAVDHRALSDVTDSTFIIHGVDDPQAKTYLRSGPLSHKVRRTASLDGVRVAKKRRPLFA